MCVLPQRTGLFEQWPADKVDSEQSFHQSVCVDVCRCLVNIQYMLIPSICPDTMCAMCHTGVDYRVSVRVINQACSSAWMNGIGC